VVRRVREDARVFVTHGVVEDEHSLALQGTQTQVQAGPTEQRPELGLEALETRVRHDGFLVDQVPLERGENFLIGDVDGLQDHEPAQDEFFRWQQLTEKVDVDVAALKRLLDGIRERRYGLDWFDLHEARIELQLEVAFECRRRIHGGEDDGNLLDAKLD